MANDLLIELFTEELPPKALAKLSESFSQQIHQALSAKGLLSVDSISSSFATPRRLGVRLSKVLAQAADRSVELKGPSVKVALDAQGKPTQALIKWAEKQGMKLEQLTRVSDGKQEIFSARTTLRGDSLADVIGAILTQTLAKLPVPKLMQYQLADGTTTVEFVRPAHSLIVLHGNSVVPASVLGLQAQRSTQGHRFLSSGPIDIQDAGDYERALQACGRVLANLGERRKVISEQLEKTAAAHGANLGQDADVQPLLDEVTALVEWPVVYVGQFESAFLAVPQECLILTMRTNQKYFPLFDAQGKLLAKFLIVSNMAVDDPTLIVDGNERVVRSRLADARFFYEQDRKVTLASRLPQLASVVYHAKLGTQAQRSERVQRIATHIVNSLSGSRSPRIGATDQSKNSELSLLKNVQDAARLAKADLLTGMVGEFPELQGLMGRYYAQLDNESPEVADAIADHYCPRFAGDQLPRGLVGQVLALADKLETLCGLFAIGQLPTGDRDPFALRRHALGVLRILIEAQLPLDLRNLIDTALGTFEPAQRHNAQASLQLQSFFMDRLTGYLRERGFTSAEVAAVLESVPTQFSDLIARLEAVRSFSQLPAAAALAAANKRTGNILKKTTPAPGVAVQPQLLREPAERALADVVDALTPLLDERLAHQDFAGALALLAQARDPVDAFFTDVMVMAEEPQLRDNRLALLYKLHGLMNRVADISKLSA